MRVLIVLFLLVGVKANNVCDKLIYDGLKVMDKIRNEDMGEILNGCKRYALCGSEYMGYEEKCVSLDYNINNSKFYKELPSDETLKAICSEKQLDIYYIAWAKLYKYKLEQGKRNDEISLQLWLDWDESRKCKD